MRFILILLGLILLAAVALMAMGRLSCAFTANSLVPVCRLNLTFDGGVVQSPTVERGSTNATITVPKVEMTNTTVTLPTIEVKQAPGASPTPAAQ